METKIASYESFIEDRLKSDLYDIQTALRKKALDYERWQGLKSYVHHVRSRNTESMTRFDFGLGIYMHARLENVDKLIVNIGCDCYLEMYHEEAHKYIDLRMKYLRKEIEFFHKQAVNIKAHIKLVLLAIGELKKV